MVNNASILSIVGVLMPASFPNKLTILIMLSIIMMLILIMTIHMLIITNIVMIMFGP